MYDRTTVQGATFNMRGQLYRGHANSTALSSGQCTGLRVGRPRFKSWPGQGVVPLGRAGEKNASPAFRLG